MLVFVQNSGLTKLGLYLRALARIGLPVAGLRGARMSDEGLELFYQDPKQLIAKRERERGRTREKTRLLQHLMNFGVRWSSNSLMWCSYASASLGCGPRARSCFWDLARMPRGSPLE